MPLPDDDEEEEEEELEPPMALLTAVKQVRKEKIAARKPEVRYDANQTDDTQRSEETYIRHLASIVKCGLRISE